MTNQKTLVIIFGPTGVGKTDLSIDVATHFNSDILSCDSRQMYKELNIGVAKPENHQLELVKHHFINSVSIDEHYSIYQYEYDCVNLLTEYFKTHDIAIMCGGSGLYIDAVCNGVDEMPDPDDEIRNNVINFYQNNGLEGLRFELKKIDPIYYSQVDLKNPNRIMRALEIFYQTGKAFSEFRTSKNIERDFKIIKIGINLDRAKLYERINIRVDKMMEQGLFEEAERFYEKRNLVALKTIGYKELFMCIDKTISLNDAIELIKKNSRNYAKRQLTWFRRYNDAVWYEPTKKDELIENIEKEITLKINNKI
jgi:tRNA dimethylallyltransferase